MKAVLAITTIATLTRALAVAQQDPDPNDDAEVFSGPFNSNAGDHDSDYGFFFPRVRVFLIPVSSVSRSDDNDYFSDYSDAELRTTTFDSLFSILNSFFDPR